MDNEKFQELVLKKFELLDTLAHDVSNLNSKVDKIDASQVRMENELTEKVRALFDAREVQNDVNEKMLYSLNRIEAKVDVLQMETANIRRVK
jgi:ABC-type phosphate transport system auxiliary subunit